MSPDRTERLREIVNRQLGGVLVWRDPDRLRDLVNFAREAMGAEAITDDRPCYALSVRLLDVVDIAPADVLWAVLTRTRRHLAEIRAARRRAYDALRGGIGLTGPRLIDLGRFAEALLRDDRAALALEKSRLASKRN